MPRRALPLTDVAVVDLNNALMTRDWYDFFRERFAFGIVTLAYGVKTLPADTFFTANTDTLRGDNFLIVPVPEVPDDPLVPSPPPTTIAAPTNPVAGQVITYTISNTTGGALGAITWAPVFKMVAWVNPAAGFSRTITFHFNGTNWIERYRSAADVPN